MTGDTLGVDLAYSVDDGLLGATLASVCVELDADDETREFVRQARAGRHGLLRGALHAVLRQVLSDFDVNGLLRTYPLFLLSAAQWRGLLGARARGRLLDVGAGSGDVSARLAQGFAGVVAVETSWAMARRLRARGFQVRRADLTTEAVPDPPYDVITLLNVLDRSARPRTLLSRVGPALADGGSLVISMPLPYRPHWYDGGETRDPLEPLGIEDGPWEHALRSLVDRVIEPAGYVVRRFTRAPYLSGGDASCPLYVLDAAVLVCERAGGA